MLFQAYFGLPVKYNVAESNAVRTVRYFVARYVFVLDGIAGHFDTVNRLRAVEIDL